MAHRPAWSKGFGARQGSGRDSACAALWPWHAQAEPKINASRTGVAVFADDFKTIRTFAERDNSNIVHWSEFPDSGHYAAMERPDVLIGDLRTFFREAA